MNELIKISEEKVVRVQAVKSIFTVSATKGDITTKFDITGISIIPQFIEIKPNDIRNSIINKEQTKGGTDNIEKYTRKGIYIVNIRDYSSNEIQYLSRYISNKLLSEIWTLLTARNTKPFTISLKDKKVKEIILEENSNIFKNENEFDIFCSKYGLSIKSFIEPANFSELDIKLKEVEARFDLEQFFARRYLFCYTLIEKLKKRISEYISNGNQINAEKLNLVNLWIERINQKLEVLKHFKDYYKLYDIPKFDNKIEIKDSNNVNIISGNLLDSKITQESNKSSNTESKFSKRVSFWMFIIVALGLIVTIIINWDKIF